MAVPSPGRFEIRWNDDFTLEVAFDGAVDKSLIESTLAALRDKLADREKPWAMLYTGETITRVSPDLRGAALEMLRFVNSKRPAILVGATSNLPARMIASTLGFALGLRFEVVDTRDEALRRIAEARRRV